MISDTTRVPVAAAARARLGTGGLDALNHKTRPPAAVRADGELVAVVAEDGDDPTAGVVVALWNTKAVDR